jgi:hypothetical protein
MRRRDFHRASRRRGSVAARGARAAAGNARDRLPRELIAPLGPPWPMPGMSRGKSGDNTAPCGKSRLPRSRDRRLGNPASLAAQA